MKALSVHLELSCVKEKQEWERDLHGPHLMSVLHALIARAINCDRQR